MQTSAGFTYLIHIRHYPRSHPLTWRKAKHAHVCLKLMFLNKPEFSKDTCLGPKVCCGAHILVLSFGRAPGVVQLEALVAVAGLAVHAALRGLLLLWRLTDVAHDCDSCPGSLAVALDDAFQSEVAKQHADAALAEVYVVLAAWARDGGDPGSHGASAPPRGRDGAWGRGEEASENRARGSRSLGSPSLVRGSGFTCEQQC